MTAVLPISLSQQQNTGMCSAAPAISMDQNNALLSTTATANGHTDDENDGKIHELELPNDNGRNSFKTMGNSPRYEAFVMTGEKILRLNPKISPSYAKLKKSELPSHIQVCDNSPVRGPFSDLENNFHYHNASYLKEKEKNLNMLHNDEKQTFENGDEFRSKVSASLNEISMLPCENSDDRPLSFVEDENVFTFEKNASLITVQGNFSLGPSISTNAVLPAHSLRMYDDFGSGLFDLPSPISPVFISEPSTPAKFAFNSNSNTAKKTLDKKEIFTKSLSSFDEIVPEEPKARKTLEKTMDSIEFEPSTKNDQSKLSNCTLSSISPTSVSSSLSSSTPIKEKLLHLDSNLSSQQQTLAEKDKEAAKRLAKRLYTLDGFKKSDVAKNLSKNNEFGNLVAVEYLNLFDFTGLKLDEAIRKLLSHFCLTGETSERERILWYFSRRYHECNSTVFHAEDEVHTLTCALLLLNTDLHGQNVNKRMSCNDFIDNISQTGFKYSRNLLKSLYHSIKRSPIEWAKDNGNSQFGKKKLSINLRAVGLTDHESQVVYKKGWVMRKCIVEDNGKNTPFGRRSWRMFYATLKGMLLYLHQDENGFKKGSFLTFRNSIRIHHAFALKATDYTKKQNVFRLQTATSAEYLFQASDPNEMSEWIDEINFAAARFSTPCLPSAIGSRDSAELSTSKSSLRRRPSTLPASRTKYSYKEQLKNHEFRLDELQKQLDENHKYLPSRNAKSKILQIYAENEIFLLIELQRYSTYIHLMQSRLNSRPAAAAAAAAETAATVTAKAPNLSEVLEVSNEDLHNNNNQHSVSMFPSNNNSKITNCDPALDGNVTINQTDRNSYKAAISECMSLKEIYETNF